MTRNRDQKPLHPDMAGAAIGSEIEAECSDRGRVGRKSVM